METPVHGLRRGDLVAGRYRVEGVLGQGGFGAVLRAVQENIGRPVALKLLHPDLLAHERVVKRFLREAELAQRLEHPNTVRLLDVGQTKEGAPFLVFELVEGAGLDEVIRAEGRLPVERAKRIGSQVLKSLEEAHGKQVVHRDLKPANIMLCDFPGERDFVKVIDFGIGKALDGSALGFTTLTQAGSVFGTPSYIAPECIRGDEVTPGADLYALGLILAEMVSGRMVVTGDSVISVCGVHLGEGPLELPAEAERSVLGPVIRRAVEKDPARRCRSAEEMLEALEAAGAEPVAVAAADPTPVEVPRTLTLAPAASGLTARRLFVIALVAVLAVAGAGGVFGMLVVRYLGQPDSRPAVSAGAPPPAPIPGAAVEPPSNDWPWMTPEEVEARVRLAGWTPHRPQIIDQGSTPNFTVGLMRGGMWVGSVNCSRHVSRQTAETVAASFQGNPTLAAAREGRAVIWVMAGDLEESRRVLNVVVTGRP